jgi:acyl-CoA thioesterase-2
VTGLEVADDLESLLTLERLDRDLFRARNANYGPRKNLFGGQVAAQSLLAAAATVDAERVPHSFHGYFLRPGQVDLPVILEVDRDRDGRSFSARHVVAVQEGDVIFSMVASFHIERDSAALDAAPRRDVPDPEDTLHRGRFPLLDVREVTPADLLQGVFTDCMWVRSSTPLSDDPRVHRAALTLLSDLGTGFGQASAEIGRAGPSIDHSMWFHEEIRADDWVLVDLRPVKARSSRGTYQGSLRDRDGRLGAILAQEMLLIPGFATERFPDDLSREDPPRPEPEPDDGRRAEVPRPGGSPG